MNVGLLLLKILKEKKLLTFEDNIKTLLKQNEFLNKEVTNNFQNSFCIHAWHASS